MRVSTQLVQDRALQAMLERQSDLSRTQLQLSTGRRILSPSDDPSASADVVGLMQSKEITAQYQRNVDVAQSRLELEEVTLTGSSELLQRVRELTLQANNATLATQIASISRVKFATVSVI